MSNERYNLPDDVLEHAAGAIRDMDVPRGPSAALIEATLAKMPVRHNHRRPLLIGRWSIAPTRSMARLAMAAMLVIAFTLAFTLYSRPSTTWASVLGQLHRQRSVSFRTKMTMPGLGGEPQNLVLDTTVVEPQRMRSVIAPGWVVTIWDFHQGRTLVLVPAMKRALLIEMQHMPTGKKPIDILAELKSTTEQAGTRLPDEEFDGRLAKRFRIDRDSSQMTVWVDPQTQLPVRVDIEARSSVSPATRMTITDFVWDPPIDESQFSLVPPSDYSVLPLVLDVAPVGEQDVVNAMRKMAELNGGRFAAGLDMGALGQAGQRIERNMAANRESAQWKQFESKMLELTPLIGRAWAFVNDPSKGVDWHYAGADVELGKAGIPILWYRPPFSDKYRVINADLSAYEALPGDLPRVPSVRLGPTTMPTTRPDR